MTKPPREDFLLHDEDIPPMSLWRSLLFILACESPRMSEIRLGAWTFLWGAVVSWPHAEFFGRSLVYLWLAPIPQAFIGWPMMALGLFQLWCVVSRHTGSRLWAARLQVIVSVAFAVGCTACAGLTAPAWVTFVLHGLWSCWTLWRLSPPGRPQPPPPGPDPKGD